MTYPKPKAKRCRTISGHVTEDEDLLIRSYCERNDVDVSTMVRTVVMKEIGGASNRNQNGQAMLADLMRAVEAELELRKQLGHQLTVAKFREICASVSTRSAVGEVA